ncbi:hypothetical protein CEXT_35461 [Caerostris extrusa]|uniref:Uncharacterized protein n=1 Tax=Caerostris extrusa TaxID=172846 RepID=A0AAV4UHJ2_CAEEX|nr:hypothetical protein CEXT_35461 [Caerostris extrusa]
MDPDDGHGGSLPLWLGRGVGSALPRQLHDPCLRRRPSERPNKTKINSCHVVWETASQKGGEKAQCGYNKNELWHVWGFSIVIDEHEDKEEEKLEVNDYFILDKKKGIKIQICIRSLGT